MFAALFNERRRSFLVPLAALVLAAGYLFVVLPLARRVDQLNEPLNAAWRKLSASLGQTNNVTIDFTTLTNQLDVTSEAMTALEIARKKAAARTALGEAVLERMRAPFQLVVYEEERGKQQDDLFRLATQNQVALAPAVFDGFPAHTADVRQPSLLWAELALVQDLLTMAIHCKVTGIQSLSVPIVFTNAPPPSGVRSITEIPIRMDLIGEAPKVASFLQSLPLRGEELSAAGLPAVATNKPALYLDRLVLRREVPEKPDEVHASLRIVGYVFR